MANDEWRTPKQVFNALDAEFEFCADMASDDDNKKLTSKGWCA